MKITRNNNKVSLSFDKDDFEFQVFMAGGHGGSNQNKTATAVRCVHEPSGAVGIARDEREQHRNKKLAFQRCANTPQFKFWCEQKLQEFESGLTLEQKVDREMAPENIQVDVKDENGRWVKESNETTETGSGTTS